MKLASAAEMRAIDQKATADYGIPGIVLMENAGRRVAEKIVDILGNIGDKKIYVFAGKGNNGGDGYVVARHLFNSGAKVKVFLVGTIDSLSGDALSNCEIIRRMDIDVLEIVNERDWDKVRLATAFADCLVDGLLGTGYRGEMNAGLAQAVEIMQTAGKPVVAIDIPSGVDADSGQIRGNAVKADWTVTFGLPKPGLFLYPGSSRVGKLVIADIGLPKQLLQSESIKQNLITAVQIRNLLPQRSLAAHKGTCGRVLVIAGSAGLTGAAALTATGALRAGAGLVTLGIATSLHDIMEIKLTEVMTVPLPETVGGAIGMKALPYIEQQLAKCDVLAIGPGLGTGEETMSVVREIVRHAEKPLVIDADALNALVNHTDILLESQALAVLTPHPGEMARLTGLTPSQINQDRLRIARDAACQWGCIIVLKGAGTVVAYPDGEVFVNPTGNAGMATGGTGDVLTGIIAGLAAQGLSSHEAAVAGVFIHGLAGDKAARKGMVGMTAGDLASLIPAAIKAIFDSGEGVTLT